MRYFCKVPMIQCDQFLQGEELGMTDVHISWSDTQDPQACNTNSTVYETVSRDPARTPFQWDSGLNAGFSTAAKTWLPVAQNYTINNVQLQTQQLHSHLKVFKSLLRLRQHPTMQYGQISMVSSFYMAIANYQVK